jgi:hypothetical protein
MNDKYTPQGMAGSCQLNFILMSVPNIFQTQDVLVLSFVSWLLPFLLLLLLTASGYVTGGTGTTIHNTIQYTKKHKITHTHSKQYTTQ